ncbi:MAG TPA: hypothetical protein VEA92_01595 [Candidatus Paceibacterota bacterium]|nr:hypothetical protein [Candidatus Paceibacterota bacterium]
MSLPPILNEDNTLSFAAFGYVAAVASVLVTGSLIWCWLKKKEPQ